jgi:type I restriction-modification system DNA methylase subunit
VNDSHYTPKKLADYLVSRIKKNNVKTVADFCVGEGELLKAAKKNGMAQNVMGMIFLVK